MRLAGILLVVILVMGGVGYWYYNDTQARMAILQDNNAKLNIAVQTRIPNTAIQTPTTHAIHIIIHTLYV